MKNNVWRYLRNFFTAFIIVLIPIYWHYYGPENFLWLSDIGLFLTLLALWANSDLIMSMAAVGVFALESLWCIDFFSQLVFKTSLINLSTYMFDSSYPLPLRILSLFHIVTPIIWILYLKQYGYDRRALYYFTILYWIIILTTWLITPEAKNINWVFSHTSYGMLATSPYYWLVFMLISFPLCIFLPTHYVYTKLFRQKHN